MSNAGPPSLLERARLEILHLRIDASDDLWRSFDSALEVSAKTLEVRRVGVWFMTATRATLYRARIHDTEHPGATADMVLPLERWPAYRDAVLSRRVVAAHEARTDPRTAELREGYLDVFGITALLDAPLFLGGEVCGVICHEHIGPARVWTQREMDFAASVADMLSTMLEQSMRLAAEHRLRLTEQHVARAQQLALAARAAAGIAHDVNTVLQVISANAESARAATDLGARNAALLSILEDCQRSARILDQLRDLEKPRSTFDEPLDLAEVLSAMRPTLEALGTPRTLLLETEDESFVAATRTDLERIVLNLVTNAVDATGEDATLRVAARQVEGDVVLEVSDDGVGLDAEQAERVFEPFYSTKGEGHGGLGLFIVHATSARSGGAVTLRSVPGRGATFTVTWPGARSSS